MLNKKLGRREMLTMTAALAVSPLILPGHAAAARRRPTPATLTAAEENDLTFMREEEKLARDVYLSLYAEYETPVFAKIAASEQQHMDALLALLNAYGVPDPTAGMLVGEFVNAELQDLFNNLVVADKGAAAAALMVGGLIEETDIEDLQSAIANSRLRDIVRVYGNLLNGSFNHLRAFARNYTALTGLPYVAQVLPQKTVDEILGG